MNTDDLIAIDVHVHLETELDDNEANDAARKYFGDSGVGRNRYELADYYRSRKIVRVAAGRTITLTLQLHRSEPFF